MLGVFALRNGFVPGFTNLYQGHNTLQPTATPSGTVFFQDPLTSNTHYWLVLGGYCFFANGSYHIENNYICFAPAGDPGPNYTVSVDVKEVNGFDDYPFGLSLRIAAPNNVFEHYDFGIDSLGEWVFYKVNGSNATKLHGYTANEAINQGNDVNNTLKVVVRGSTYTCYVNNTLVGTVYDATFTSGKVGLFSNKYEAAFNNLLITQP